MAGVATAALQPGVSVVSMSWGFAEGQDVFAADEAAYDSTFTKPGVTFVASTGDYGAADPEFPAMSPNVLAVGGTSLSVNADNSCNNETGWGYVDGSSGTLIGSGGGISQFEAEPSYQNGVQSTGYRTTPDVSFVADPSIGAWIADSYNLSAGNPFEIAGGTSLSAPSWAGLIALANQGRHAIGQATLNSGSPTDTQQALYGLPQTDYNVIASGNNGYSAGPGYNLVTGLGTPQANLLVPDLAAWQPGASSSRVQTVAPIQSANLIFNGADSGGGSVAAFQVFSFEIAGAGQPGYASAPGTLANSPAIGNAPAETAQQSVAAYTSSSPLTVSTIPSVYTVNGIAFSSMSGSQTNPEDGGAIDTFDNVAQGFVLNTAVAYSGNSTAHINDSPMSDTYVGQATDPLGLGSIGGIAGFSYMYVGAFPNFNEFDVAYGFGTYYATSTLGGDDIAYPNAPANDVFSGAWIRAF
jgi:hypothetical protein